MTHKIALYKYKPLATVEELKHLEDCLKQQIWVPPLTSLNDPFEGHFKFDNLDPASFESNGEVFNSHLEHFQKNGEPNLSAKELSDRLKTSEFKNNWMRHNKKELINNFFSGHGVFCLTACPSNIPMWAHYGNYHRGYCLIFELDLCYVVNNIYTTNEETEKKEYTNCILNGEEIVSFSSNPNNEFKFVFAKVKYAIDPPTLSYEEMSKFQDDYSKIKYLIHNSIGVKFMQWNYENEYRLVVNQNSQNGGLIDLIKYAPFLKVRGLIMGKNLNIKDVFKELCQRNKVYLYQAECSDEEYKITLTKILDHGRSTGFTSLCKCCCLSTAIV